MEEDTDRYIVSRFIELVRECNQIVFFGGAGVSTESGIPDFRSADGLYHMRYPASPETILSIWYLRDHPEEFFRFYREKMLYLSAKPNVTHKKLAELERAGKLSAVITQNIDGLHQMAGSRTVYELHGSVYGNRCMKCGKKYTVDKIVNSTEIPRCSCGGIVRPDVVLYGEQLNSEVMRLALSSVAKADMLIVGGTSLSVYPAAGIINYFGGKHLVLINRDETPYDMRAELVIHKKLGDVFSKL